MVFRPVFYLTDSWGCPDEVPAIGIPFYLADRRLTRIEEEQTGEIEDARMLLMFLRHEAGHAINYAYRLWEQPEWAEHFGVFTRPYRDVFRPDPLSRRFVRHITADSYGRSYAQKHPDEDFAETFAVWLTPRSSWKRRYRNWPAMQKLNYVARLMRTIRDQPPLQVEGALCNPIEEMKMLLAEHYGQRAERYRAAAQGYVDDKLREVFPPTRERPLLRADELIRRHHATLSAGIARWAGLTEEEVGAILAKLEDRAGALRLKFRVDQAEHRLMDVTALTTALAMDFTYTGRFTG